MTLATESGTGVQRKKLVLVVDDDAPVLDSLSQVLRGEGYTVISAQSGRDALAYLRTKPHPDVAILDLMMPVMDGWTLASAIRAEPSLARTPLIIMSASGERGLSRAPVAMGYLAKPIHLDQLLSLVESVLQRLPPRSNRAASDEADADLRTSTHKLAIPTILAVGCSSHFLKRHQETAAFAGAVMRATDAAGVGQAAITIRPVAFVVTEAFHRLHGEQIETLGHAVDASVIQIRGEDISDHQLEARMRAAVQRRYPPVAPTAPPAPTPPPAPSA
jgi:CheY-like chemotaxis protein